MITIEPLPGLDFTNGVIAKGFRFAIRNTSARLRSMTFNILEEIGRLRCIYKIVNCIMLWPIPIPPVAAHLWEDFCQESSGTTRRAKDVIHPPAAGIGLQAPPRGPHTFVGEITVIWPQSLMLTEQNQPQGNFPRSGWKWPEGLWSRKRLHSRPEAPHSQPRPRPCIGSVLRCWPRW